MTTAKRYELRVDGRILDNLSETAVTELYRSGRISSITACRPRGATEWQELNEFFPLLKYERPATEREADSGDARLLPGDNIGVTWLNQWKVGVLCFAAGLGCAGAALWVPEMTGSTGRGEARSGTVLRAEPIDLPVAVSEAVLAAQKASRSRRLGSSRSPGDGAAANRARPAAQQFAQPTNVVSPPVAPSEPKIGPQEATITLMKWTTVRSAFGDVRLKIREDGPSTISVWTDYSDEPRQLEKVKGFEANGTNCVQIYSLPGAKVYYVDRLTAPIGYCVVKVVPEEA